MVRSALYVASITMADLCAFHLAAGSGHEAARTKPPYRPLAPVSDISPRCRRHCQYCRGKPGRRDGATLSRPAWSADIIGRTGWREARLAQYALTISSRIVSIHYLSPLTERLASWARLSILFIRGADVLLMRLAAAWRWRRQIYQDGLRCRACRELLFGLMRLIMPIRAVTILPGALDFRPSFYLRWRYYRYRTEAVRAGVTLSCHDQITVTFTTI